MPQRFKKHDWVKVIATDKKVQVIEYIKDIGVSLASAMGQAVKSRDDFYTNKIKCRTFGETTTVKIFSEEELEFLEAIV